MKWILIFLFVCILGVGSFYLVQKISTPKIVYSQTETSMITNETDGAPTSSTTDKGQSVSGFPAEKLIPNLAWVAQTFNNCSSVALMITLSHWGIVDTQEAIAEGTRPWNNPKGNNDDKSVTLYELADYAASKHSMLTYVRPNGTIELLKVFVANDIPVLTRTLMYQKDDIVHYRVVRGFNEKKRVIIESDGVEGKEVEYSYEDWLYRWKDFNYSYLIMVPKDKQQIVEKILGEELDEKTAWSNAKIRAEREIANNPNNLVFAYNHLVALYYLGDYQGTVREFEAIESKLTRRKLWYQMEPIEAYFKLGNFDRVIELTDYIANDNNKSISELYVLKGEIYEKRGDTVSAQKEYEKALYYNKNLQSAKDKLKL